MSYKQEKNFVSVYMLKLSQRYRQKVKLVECYLTKPFFWSWILSKILVYRSFLKIKIKPAFLLKNNFWIEHRNVQKFGFDISGKFQNFTAWKPEFTKIFIKEYFAKIQVKCYPYSSFLTMSRIKINYVKILQIILFTL